MNTTLGPGRLPARNMTTDLHKPFVSLGSFQVRRLHAKCTSRLLETTRFSCPKCDTVIKITKANARVFSFELLSPSRNLSDLLSHKEWQRRKVLFFLWNIYMLHINIKNEIKTSRCL